MKTDIYTKAILTVIAALLAGNLFVNLRIPSVQAQGSNRLQWVHMNDHKPGAAILGTCSQFESINCLLLESR